MTPELTDAEMLAFATRFRVGRYVVRRSGTVWVVDDRAGGEPMFSATATHWATAREAIAVAKAANAAGGKT